MKINRQTENKSSPVRKIISILLAAALTVTLTGMLAAGNLNLLTGPGALDRITRQALTAPPLLQVPAGIPPEADSTSTEFSALTAEKVASPAKIIPVSWDFSLEGLMGGIEDLVLDIILEVIRSRIDSGQAMDPQLLWAFYDQSPSRDFLTEKMVGQIRDLIYDTHTTHLTLDEVDRLIRENEELLSEAFGVRFTKLHRAVCVKLVEHSGALDILNEEGLLGLLRWTAEADRKNGQARLQQLEETERQLAQLRQYRKPSNLALLGAAALVLLALLWLTNFHRPGLCLACAGGAAAISGLLWTIPLLAGLFRPGLLTAASLHYMDGLLNEAGMLEMVKLILPLCVTVLIVGVALQILGVILDRKRDVR